MSKADKTIKATKSSDDGALTAPISVTDRQQMLPANRFLEGSFARNVWGATLAAETAYDDVLQPWFWRLVGRRLSIGDEIIVRNDALTFWAQLLVVSADPVSGHVELRELLRKSLAPVAVEAREQTGFSAEYRGLTDQWCIVRDHDQHTMKTRLPSQDEAMRVIRTQYLPGLAGQMHAFR